MKGCTEKQSGVAFISSKKLIKFFVLLFFVGSIALILLALNTFIFPSRDSLYKEYYNNATGKSVAQGRKAYENYIKNSLVYDVGLLDYYFIYLVDNECDLAGLNEYINDRLESASSIFNHAESFIKLLAVVKMNENMTGKNILDKDTFILIRTLMLEDAGEKNNVWHFFLRYSCGVNSFYLGSNFDNVFSYNLAEGRYENLIEMLSRSETNSFNDYLYPIINFSFIQIQVPYTDVVSKDKHKFLDDRSVRRFIIKNILMFKNDQDAVIETVNNVSNLKNKFWLNYRK